MLTFIYIKYIFVAQLLLRALRSVFGTRLLAICNTCGVERTADNMVTRTGQVFYSAAADQYDAMLLKVVTLARNVTRNFDSVRKTNSGNLTKCGIRLLRRRSLNRRAYAALLRRGRIRRTLS